MKVNSINAITPYNKTVRAKNNTTFSNVSSPSFNGMFDLFQQQMPRTKEQEISEIISNYSKNCIRQDKITKNNGKWFFRELKVLLNNGARSNYKGAMPYVGTKDGQKNATYSDIDETLGVPALVNIWLNGQLNAVYEIFSLEPETTYHYTSYQKDCQSSYIIKGKTVLSHIYTDNDNNVARQYPSDNGFVREEGIRTGEDEFLLLTKLYYDYKNPEESYYIENTPEGVKEYGYNKKQKMWLELPEVKHKIEV